MTTQAIRLTEAEIWRTACLMRDFFGTADRAYSAAVKHSRIVRGSPSGEECWNRIAGALKAVPGVSEVASKQCGDRTPYIIGLAPARRWNQPVGDAAIVDVAHACGIPDPLSGVRRAHGRSIE